MPLTLILNGQPREFPELPTTPTLQQFLDNLGLKGDRIAVEHNGEIAPRSTWPQTQLADHDRLEVVHFVGGGSNLKSPPSIRT